MLYIDNFRVISDGHSPPSCSKLQNSMINNTHTQTLRLTYITSQLTDCLHGFYPETGLIENIKIKKSLQIDLSFIFLSNK